MKMITMCCLDATIAQVSSVLTKKVDWSFQQIACCCGSPFYNTETGENSNGRIEQHCQS